MTSIVSERIPLSKSQLDSLRTYIVRKRQKKNDNTSTPKKSTTYTETTNNTSSLPMESHDDSHVTCDKAEPLIETGHLLEQAPDINEQLKSLKDKLELLKKEKHSLFQELKKVLHEEEEKRKQQQKEQDQQYQQQGHMVHSEYYRDPRIGGPLPSGSMGGGIRQSWSNPLTSTHKTPPSKLHQSNSLQDLSRYQTPPHYLHPQMQGYHHSYSPQGLPPPMGGTGGGRTNYKEIGHNIPPPHPQQQQHGNVTPDFYHNKDLQQYSPYYNTGMNNSGYQYMGGVSGQFYAHNLHQQQQTPPTHDHASLYSQAPPPSFPPNPQYEMMPTGRPGGVGGGGYPSYDPRQQNRYLMNIPPPPPPPPNMSVPSQQEAAASNKGRLSKKN